jgi:hypothetical protein
MENLLKFTINFRESYSQTQWTVQILCKDRVLLVWADLRIFYVDSSIQNVSDQFMSSINLDLLTLSDPTLNLFRQYNFPVPLRCRKMSDTVFVAFVRPLSEPVRRFFSYSTDFS